MFSTVFSYLDRWRGDGGWNEYDEYGDGGESRYAGYADKSAAAKRRESAAMQAFADKRAAVEADGVKVTVQLLEPSTHLTTACWTTFSRHVRSHKGWRAKRREATADEKRKAGETRKGKTFFTDVIFTPTNTSASVDSLLRREKPLPLTKSATTVGAKAATTVPA